MIEINHEKIGRRWQQGFLDILPRIERLLKFEFRRFRPNEREEAIQNAIALCFVAYKRLYGRGRARVANAWSLARFAARQHRGGRIAGGHLNSKDPMSRYAAMRSGTKQLRLHGDDSRNCNWIDEVVADKRAGVHDVVAARLDSKAWFNTLRSDTKKVAVDLAQGCSTADAARKHRVSPGRISQIRRELERSWKLFQHEPVLE